MNVCYIAKYFFFSRFNICLHPVIAPIRRSKLNKRPEIAVGHIVAVRALNYCSIVDINTHILATIFFWYPGVVNCVISYQTRFLKVTNSLASARMFLNISSNPALSIS